MRYYADLHIHSRFSRATSESLTPEQLWLWAQIKGVGVVATGDCIHPGWYAELAEKLTPCGDGFFELKEEHTAGVASQVPAACRAPVRFILSTEISSIYKRDGKVRKVHNVLYMPDFATLEKLQVKLEAIGNIRSDGRPILGLDSRDLLEILLSCNPDSFLIPAHIWTPWFSVLGSKSGFDAIEECYGDLTKYIYALETGLSSDPLMNWRLSKLDKFVLVSNSDAHSPSKLGREANIFDTDLTYAGILNALRDPEDKGLAGTIEFFPEEGKYHYDGHRKCETRLHPRDTLKNKGLCPVCGKPVTVGVMARVEELATRAEGEKGGRWRPYHSMIPLSEIIGDCLGVGQASRKVDALYRHIVGKLGSEFHVLLDAPIDEIEKTAGDLVAEGIRRVRAKKVSVAAGYDGEYGTIAIFSDRERGMKKWQANLFGEEPFPGQNHAQPGHDAAAAGRHSKKKLLTEEYPQQSISPALAVAEEQGKKETSCAAELNDAQKAAVDHKGSHLLIVAGPGTGKTHTITCKIAQTARSCKDNEKILAVTFTNKAAEEMRQRIARRCDGPLLGRVVVATFHGFCLMLLREYGAAANLPQNFTIATDRQRDDAALSALVGSSAAGRRELLEAASRIKGSAAAGAPVPPQVEAYNRALREKNLLDFDDLLFEAMSLLAKNEDVLHATQALYRYIFVDEFQDISNVQHELLRLLVNNGVVLTAIGDPNQAIYGFRGSDVRFFSLFSRTFPGAAIVYLSDNYRSATALLAASGNVLAKGAFGSVPAPTARLFIEGKLVLLEAATDRAEAEYVVHQIEKLVGGTSMFSHDSGRIGAGDAGTRSFSDFGVLYRTNAQNRVLSEAFDRSGIPYQVSGEKPLSDQPLVNDILGFLLMAAKPGKLSGMSIDRAGLFEGARDDPGLKALVSDAAGALKRSGVPAALQALLAWPAFKGIISANGNAKEVFGRLQRIAGMHPDVQAFVDYILLQQCEDGIQHRAEKVSLLTLHAAKGLEFPVVFITGCEDGLLPLSIGGMTGDPAEERRLLYVGMTRAKELLYLTRARSRTLYGKTAETRLSPFVNDIRKELVTYEKTVMRERAKKDTGAQQTSFIQDLFE